MDESSVMSDEKVLPKFDNGYTELEAALVEESSTASQRARTILNQWRGERLKSTFDEDVHESSKNERKQNVSIYSLLFFFHIILQKGTYYLCYRPL